MRLAKPIITLFALGAIAFGIYYLFFPPPEKVIRKRLNALAQAISARPEGNIATIANVNKIGSFFHPEVSVSLDGFRRDVGSISGRGELQQMALAARQRVTVSVQFYNFEVQVGSERTNATGTATALVKLNDDPNAMIQELMFEFEKLDRAWVIRNAQPKRVQD